jgi:hypothetical protein
MAFVSHRSANLLLLMPNYCCYLEVQLAKWNRLVRMDLSPMKTAGCVPLCFVAFPA